MPAGSSLPPGLLHHGQAVGDGHQPRAGAPGSGGGGVGGDGGLPAAGGMGGGSRAQGVTLLPSPGDMASFSGDLMQEVVVKRRVDAAEDVGPLGRGIDRPRLRQGGPADVGDHGEEGMHHHLKPCRRGAGVGGGGAWRAGSLFLTWPHKSN